MLIVPMQPLPNQTLTTQIAGQQTQINVYQTEPGLFMDVYSDDNLIVAGVICQNANLIIVSEYLGYTGDFMWWDSQGDDDPTFDGLGSRYNLIYLAPTDLPPGYY